MSKRGGKSGRRKARQRRLIQRPVQPFSGAPAAAVGEVEREPDTPRVSATPSRQPVPSRFALDHVSRLSDRAAAEYHYVGRDLRSIGILVLVLVALLAVATIAFNALGIGPA